MIVAAATHVDRIGAMQTRLADVVPEPPRSTHGMSRDHRLPLIWTRAKVRTRRRALALIDAIDHGALHPELARLEQLMTEADRLAERLP